MYGPPQGAYDPNMGQVPMQPMGYDNAGQQMMPQPMQPMGYDAMGQPMMGQPMQPMQPMSFDNTMGQPMMGQPQMMYDPQMGQPQYDPQMAALQAQDQAAAELAALEEKQKLKDAQRKEKEVHHLAHMMRSGNRNQEDNASCATMICFWGIFNGLMWAVPLLGDNWWNKVWQGTSVRKLEMCLGLFNMWVHVECTGNTWEDRLCSAMEKYSDKGTWAIAEMKEEMCMHVPGKCSIMTRLVQAGYIPLFTLPGAAACEVLGILLLYFYWHGKPTSLVRGLALKLSCLAPLLGNLGFFGWMLWSPYMHELPRIWAEESGNKDFANSSVFGMKETFTMPMGWCCLMVFFAAISSMSRFFVQWTMPFHINEPDPYGINNNETEQLLLKEAEKIVNQA